MLSPAEIASLNQQHGIAGLAQVDAGKGGLARVMISSPEASGEIYLLGGQVTSWHPAGHEEVLFLSYASQWQEGKAIRGGIPICFPWFGNKSDDAKAPAHGFVRARSWQLDSIAHAANGVTVSVSTESDESTKKWWPADYRLTLRATFGRALHLELEMANRGSAALKFEEALHTYFRIGDIQSARIRGLDALRYQDKTDAFREKTQQGDLAIAKETDSVYLDTRHEVEIADPVLHRRIHVSKENSLSTIVWNPWTEKAKGMSDLGAEGWRPMVCVETANVGQFAVPLAPGARHVMKAAIQVASL